MIRQLFLAVALLVGATAPTAAQWSVAHDPAGRPVERTAGFAKKVERAIAERRARVAIVGRIGRDPSTLPAGMRYSHVGFWTYGAIRTTDGRMLRGYATHNLYQRDDRPDRSELKQDFPLDFFLSAVALNAGIIIPTEQVQDRLLAVIGSPAYAGLHNPNYSAIAHPGRPLFQNCTGFVLQVLVAGIYDTTDRRSIHANIARWFEPQTIAITGFERAMASLFRADVALADQGDSIETATFESIERFLRRFGLVSSTIYVED